MFDLVVIGGGIVGTFIASASVARGFRVAIIDVGPPSISLQRIAKPTVVFRRREHQGCVAARNHVLGGNGHYWGGGLMRPPSQYLGDCLGVTGVDTDVVRADLGPNFQAVERGLGLNAPPARGAVAFEGECDSYPLAAEILVLPGKTRNLARTWIDSLKSEARCAIFAPAWILGFESDETGGDSRTLRAVWANHEGQPTKIVGRRFVIAAGVVDSNLIVQSFADQLTRAGVRDGLGRGMHDHWSVPIAEVQLIGDGTFRKVIAPRFRDGLIVGRHFEFPLSSTSLGRGFLHFTFGFDDASPYREIKQLMLLRQQRASISSMLDGILPLAGQLPAITRIGLERLIEKRLYLGEGVRITATIDFESFPREDNALRLEDGQANFDWDISTEDNQSFLNLLNVGRNVLKSMEHQFKIGIEPLFALDNDDEATSHFHAVAVDAYHLGGGLSAGAEAAALDMELCLRGNKNLHVISTAAFARAGIVNPTHTLLALADRFVKQLS